MDKNKIIEAAGKLVAKGAYDKAIKEYQKVLDADPKDVRVLQKMGELFQKKNDNVQAAVYFTKVAESYATDGFFLKAVALYKQVLKLDPSLMEVNIRLAELHQQLQLIGDAMAFYQIVANHYDKAGDVKKSLETLKKMVDLDPENVASRVKLADLYAREKMNDEALAEFQRAADHLKRKNASDDHLRVLDRMSTLKPNDLRLQKEVAELYLQRGDQKKALSKLQVCFKADPRDIETLKLLSVAFQALGQTSKTISVLKELARAYEDRGQHADSRGAWAQVEQLDPNDPEVAARKAPAAAPQPQPRAPAPQAAPAPPPPRSAAPPAARIEPPPPAEPPRSTESSSRPNIPKLLTETDVYVKYGLHDKALEHLRKIFAVDPENIDAHERAYQIYVSANNQAQAFEQLLNVLRLHTRSGDAARAQPFLATALQQAPNHPEVPVFVAALGKGGQVEAPARAENEDAILVDSSEDEVIVADDSGDDGDIVSAEMAISGEETVGDELSLTPEDAAAAAAYDIEPPPVAEEDAVLPDAEAGIEEPDTNEFDAMPGATMTTEDAFADMGPGLGDLDDDITQQPTRVQAVDLEKVRAIPLSANDKTPVDGYLRPDAVADDEEPVELPPEEEEPASEECDEATFFIEQGLNDEAREILETVLIAYPEHRRAAALLAQIEGGAAVDESAQTAESDGDGGRDAFDLAQELADELGDLGASDPAPGGGDEYQVSVEEVFAEFKKGLEKVVKAEDVDTHYDLGIAYKEMGLLDDAIGEFQVARKGCLGKKKEIDCLTMVGLLNLQKGDVPAAIEAYLTALKSEHAQGETEKALRYELGLAYEAAEQPGRALAQYLKVQRIDDQYRDVAERVSTLSAVTAPEDDPPPPVSRAAGGKGPARKVGFI